MRKMSFRGVTGTFIHNVTGGFYCGKLMVDNDTVRFYGNNLYELELNFHVAVNKYHKKHNPTTFQKIVKKIFKT